MFLIFLLKPSSTAKQRPNWSESDDDAPEQQPESSPVRENPAEPRDSDRESKENHERPYGDDDMDEDD